MDLCGTHDASALEDVISRHLEGCLAIKEDSDTGLSEYAVA